MSNKQNKVNRNVLDTERDRSSAEYGGFNTQMQNASNNYGANADTTRQSVIDRYSNNNNFLPPGMAPNSQGLFSGAQQAAGGDFSKAKSTFGRFADTGGRENYADAEAGYKNFANNGGLGESEAQALRNRATGQIPAFYQAYKDTLNRRQNVQGGYSPGFDAQQAEIGRQAGREGFNASRQVEGDIADKRIAGRQFGVSGLAGIGRDVSGNMLQGAGGLTNIGQAEQQNNQFNTGEGNNFQKTLLDMYQRGGLANAQGIQGLHNTDVGQYQAAIQNWLAGMGGRSNSTLGNIGLRQQSSKGVDWARILGGIGGGLGGFGGLFGGPQEKQDNQLPFSTDTYQGT